MNRLCVEPGRGNVTAKGGRCPACRRRYERTINRAGAKLYGTKRWRMTRRRKLHLDPVCEICQNAVAEEVHHRVAIRDGGDIYSLANLVSTCKACHSRETRREQLQHAGGKVVS